MTNTKCRRWKTGM